MSWDIALSEAETCGDVDLGRARRQYPIGPPYVFAMDVPVGMSQGLRQASPYGLAARDGLAATVATCRPGGTHGPAMPDSRHKLRNAGQVFATNRETKNFAAKYA